MANGTWKIARRGNAQLPLVIVLALAVVLVLLGKAQTGPFDRARVNITDWMAPGLEKVRAPLDDVERWLGSIGEIFAVYSENLAQAGKCSLDAMAQYLRCASGPDETLPGAAACGA